MTFPIKKKKKSFVLIQAHRHIWVSSAQIPAEPRPHKAPTITTLHHRDPDLDWFLLPQQDWAPGSEGRELGIPLLRATVASARPLLPFLEAAGNCALWSPLAWSEKCFSGLWKEAFAPPLHMALHLAYVRGQAGHPLRWHPKREPALPLSPPLASSQPQASPSGA